MSTPVWIRHPLVSLLSSSLIMLPTPASLTLWWNFGSILGLCLVGQMLTGVVLAMQYVSEAASAFESVVVIWMDVHYGWWLRSLHMNGASVFFMAAYLHVGRGLYYRSYQSGPLWVSGVIILLTLMAIAFLGYVLPWGQMSFWGATVITNLISAIPYLGESVVYWVWGGYSVSAPTLTRFFAIHFLAPFVLAGLVVGHLILLHEKGSLNPVGVVSDLDKLPFHPYYSSKDLVGFIVVFMSLALISVMSPWWLGDVENFIPADPMVTPIHIKPEWYFLFAYAILRSIPNKLGGVVALGFSILILAVLPVLISGGSVIVSFLQKSMFWVQVSCFVLLTWVGGNVVEEPFVAIGQAASGWYFAWFLM